MVDLLLHFNELKYSPLECCSQSNVFPPTRQLQRGQLCKKRDRFNLCINCSKHKNHNCTYIKFKLRGLQNQIEEMQKRLEFKSSLERSFDSLQVGNLRLHILTARICDSSCCSS